MKINVRRANAVAYLAMVVLGLYLSAYQYALASITEEFALAAWISGLLITMHFMASFFIPPIAGELADRVGRRPVLLGCFGLMIIGILCAALTKNIVILGFGALITGSAACTVESSMSSLLAQVNPQNETRVMNLSQTYFCGGAVLSPLYGALLARFGLGWRFIYYTLLIVIIVCVLILLRTELPEAMAREKGLYVRRIFKRPYYVLMFFAMLLYVGIEESAAFWAGTYAQIAGGGMIGPLGLESALLAGYWFGMGVARLWAASIKRRMGLITLIGLALSALCFGAMLLFHSAWAFVLFYALAGFTLAPTWPLVMVEASRIGSDVPDTAAGGMMTAGSVGGMLVPFLLGLVQTAAGMEASFALLAGIVVLETVMLASSRTFRQA